MSRKKMLFIYNPKAGKERIRSNLLDLIDIFTKAGYEVTAYPTQGTGDAANVVMERDEKYQMITCSGGDGTLDEVVNGMMRSNQHIPIGYVPAGSTNDFAMSLGIPASMKAAAEVVLQWNGNDYTYDRLLQSAKDVWQYDQGKNVADFKKAVIYVKPEEGKAYVVVNDTDELSFDI